MCAQVLAPLGHAKLSGSYMPRVEAAFPEKAQLRVQARMSCYSDFIWASAHTLCPLQQRTALLETNALASAPGGLGVALLRGSGMLGVMLGACLPK